MPTLCRISTMSISLRVERADGLDYRQVFTCMSSDASFPLDRGVDVPGNAFGDEGRVARHAREAARSPGVQPRQADEVQARHARHAAFVHRLAAAVEDRR